MNLLTTVVAFLAALTILIFVHELGHYLVARWCGVKVLRFSIGFGKTLLTRRIGPDQTEWSISAIPLGGYVKMLDEREAGETAIDPRELPRAFNRQSLGKRSLIVAAGPVFNFILAIALYWLLNVVGVQEPVPVIGAPTAASAAAQAGFAAGDRIVAIDGEKIRSWNDIRLKMIDGVIEHRDLAIDVERSEVATHLTLPTANLPANEIEKDFLRTLGIELAPGTVSVAGIQSGSAAERGGLIAGDQIASADGKPLRRSSELIELIRSSANKPVDLGVRRNGTTLQVSVTPESVKGEGDATIGRIGASLNNQVAMQEVSYGPLEAVQRGAQQTWDMSVFSLRMMGKMLVGQLSWRNLSGPVAIADYAGQSARVGWVAYVSFLALISISLGVLNLLPIPVLDGGHLVYYGLEALRGKPLSERFVQMTQQAGLAAIGALMVLALFNDITRLIGS